MFSALSFNHGDLNNKINLFVALCPITNLGLAKNPGLKSLNKYFVDRFRDGSYHIGAYEIFGTTWTHMKGIVCSVMPCKVFHSFTDNQPSVHNDPNISRKNTDEGESSPASVKQLIHYAQLEATNDFRLYDYGEKQNMKKYGRK
jgi:hypothetical protein